ncbi:uncharacterized protein LOC120335140 [Styela clava]
MAFVIRLLTLHYFCISWISADTGFINIDNVNRPVWYSKPVDHECLNECSGIDRSTIGEVTILNRNCSVECKAGATEHHRYASERDYKKVQVWNPLTRVRSECLIGVLKEDIFCATVSVRSGVRQWAIASGNQCQKRNLRYYLPSQQCDDVPRAEIGEQTCKDACVRDAYALGQRYIRIDVMRQRAQFRVCYDGMVSESYRFGKRTSDARFHKLRGRFWPFCRAELSPCSDCFRWGNWTAITQCTSTCGSSGFITYTRSCHIKDRTGLYGERVTWNRISVSYCKAYFGGTNTKSEPCNRDVQCPEWSRWGPWKGCSNGETIRTSTSYNNGTKCRLLRQRREINLPASTTEAPIFNSTLLQAFFSTFSPLNDSIGIKKSLKIAPQTLKALQEGNSEYRTRRCESNLQSNPPKCEGNSTEYRKCDVTYRTADQGQSTLPPETSTQFNIECVEDNSDDKIQDNDSISNSSHGEQFSTEKISPMETTTTEAFDTVSSGLEVTLTRHSDPKTRRNRNHTRIADDGFTSVLKDYAPALIAGLLVFIVLLLIVLIGICGIRMMQKNRRTRYDVTSPSFSAGTMGSIPSGLVQGFSHVLGLRHGSGTFGRSETTLNGVKLTGDALSSRGSCKSMTSPVGHSAKGKNKQHPHIMATNLNGVGHTSNHTHQNSPRTRIQMRELGSRSVVATSMGSREPSASSLLSTSSTPPTSVPPNSCSLQPLPPIPLNQSPHPMGNDGSVFKRGTGRSASLNPMESDHSNFNTKSQPRAESVSGRVTCRPRGTGSESGTNWQMRQKRGCGPGTNKVSTSRNDPASEAYCVHDCDANSCCENFNGDSAAENEYWSVTRCFDSGVDSSDQNAPRGHLGEKKTFKRIQAEKEREGIRMTRLRSKPSLSEDEENIEVKMVDNVLYAVTTNACVHRSADEDEQSGPKSATSIESSLRSHLGSCGENIRSNEGRTSLASANQPFYNTIGMEESHRASEPETSVSNEDDYDHLCDQFGGPYSTKNRAKYPGTMTSLHQLRHQHLVEHDVTKKLHDYECIEFDEEEETDVMGTERPNDVKDKTSQKRARKNDYVIGPRDGSVNEM